MKFKIILVLALIWSQSGFTQELKQFLKSCGYGTLAGAGLGLASLVFEKKPNESYGNIARGASLGLYGGIAYGLYTMSRPIDSKSNDIVQNEKSSHYFVAPTLDGRIETVFLYRF